MSLSMLGYKKTVAWGSHLRSLSLSWPVALEEASCRGVEAHWEAYMSELRRGSSEVSH